MAKASKKKKGGRRQQASRRRPFVRVLASWLGRTLVVFALTSALLVLPLRWFDPATSSFMLQHLVSQWWQRNGSIELHHRWVPFDAIAPSAALAVVAAEDQRFPQHHGFDLKEIGNAWDAYRRGEKLRGASTLSQQLAKNLFLWSGRDFVRKGLEVWFTGLLELTLPKQRILELYLNLAQFGPNTYGVGMASERFFAKPASELSVRDSSRLAAVLPNPVRYRLDSPSPYVEKRAAWIRGQMKNLGGLPILNDY